MRKAEVIRGGHMEYQTPYWQHWIPVLENELAVEMQKAPWPSEVHARDHILRVLRRCIRLGEKLNADLEVLVAAVYLHDLGRHYIADQEKRDAVLHAIGVHDVVASPEDRTTLESKILYDADKIDTLGVVGVLRYIRHFYGKKPIDFMLDDIDARWQGLALSETRDLALPDYRYIKEYFVQLKAELGEDAGA
jgi:hypothetical protein